MSYRKKRRISLRKKRKGNFLKLFIFLTAILLSVYYFWGTDSGVIPQVKMWFKVWIKTWKDLRWTL